MQEVRDVGDGLRDRDRDVALPAERLPLRRLEDPARVEEEAHRERDEAHDHHVTGGHRTARRFAMISGRVRRPGAGDVVRHQVLELEVDEGGHAARAERVDDQQRDAEERRPSRPGTAARSAAMTGRSRHAGRTARRCRPRSRAAPNRSPAATASPQCDGSTMPVMTSHAFEIDSARKKIHAKHTIWKMTMRWPTARAARVGGSGRPRAVARLAAPVLELRNAAVDRAPHHERPRRAVPQPAEHEREHEVAVGLAARRRGCRRAGCRGSRAATATASCASGARSPAATSRCTGRRSSAGTGSRAAARARSPCRCSR